MSGVLKCRCAEETWHKDKKNYICTTPNFLDGVCIECSHDEACHEVAPNPDEVPPVKDYEDRL